MKSKLEANKNNNTKNNAFALSFSRPKEQPKLFPPKSKEERTRDGDDAIDYSAQKENY